MKWIRFDINNLPIDGSYIGKMNIPGRIDNPQYTKLVILNGQCHWDYAVYVTHYAIDPDTYQGYDISLPCPKCGNLVRGEKGAVMSCSECGQDISLTL